MNWSAHQRRLLDALGYELLRPGRPGTPVADLSAHAPEARAANEAPVPVARGAGAAAPALLEALRRAAGGADPRPLVADLDALRRDPAAKRALWPRLRALRKGTA